MDHTIAPLDCRAAVHEVARPTGSAVTSLTAILKAADMLASCRVSSTLAAMLEAIGLVGDWEIGHPPVPAERIDAIRAAAALVTGATVQACTVREMLGTAVAMATGIAPERLGERLGSLASWAARLEAQRRIGYALAA